MKCQSLIRAALVTVTTFAIVNFSLLEAAERPNILVIVSDDQGWGDIGYHNPEIRSPHLDRLAKTGVELDWHYVQPQCTPTRVALMTGRYPSRFGRHCTQASNEQAFPLGTLTMASMLKSIGYETAITGKWHLGSKPEWGPNQYGFDYSYGSLAGAVGMYDHRYRLTVPEFTTTWHRNGEYIEEVGHATDLTATEAVAFLRREHERPFFLYVPFHTVHTPLVEEVKWLEINEHISSPSRRLLAAAVSHLDWAVGEIIKALDETKQREKTLIIFTSDNGGYPNYRGNNYPPPDPALKNFSTNKPLRGEKTETYEGGYRVPAFVNWSGRLSPRKLTTPLHVADWMPTMASLVGYESQEDPQWDGHDIWPLLTGAQTDAPPRSVYITWGTNRRRHALRHGDWKIVNNGWESGRWELYDLNNDPYETNDLATRYPERLAELEKRFTRQAAKDKSTATDSH